MQFSLVAHLPEFTHRIIGLSDHRIIHGKLGNLRDLLFDLAQHLIARQIWDGKDETCKLEISLCLARHGNTLLNINIAEAVNINLSLALLC